MRTRFHAEKSVMTFAHRSAAAVLLVALILAPAFGAAPECPPQKAPDPISNDFLTFAEQTNAKLQVSDDCMNVDVRAAKHMGADSFSEAGEGPVFSSTAEPGKRFVLTNAHVVSNSDSVHIECNGKSIKAKVRGISETADLAVLEIDASNSKLTPVFNWNGKSLPTPEVLAQLPVGDPDYLPQGSTYLLSSPRFVDPASTRNLGNKKIPGLVFADTKIAPTPETHPLLGSRNALILTDQGIRPGMSGSAIVYVSTHPFDGKTKVLLEGIADKTYVDNTQSIVIPVETISKALPDLMKGKDPSKAANSPFYFEKKLVTNDNHVSEVPQLVFRTDKGEVRYEAACAGPYVNSSESDPGDGGSGGPGHAPNVGDSGDGDGGSGGPGHAPNVGDSGDGDGGSGGPGHAPNVGDSGDGDGGSGGPGHAPGDASARVKDTNLKKNYLISYMYSIYKDHSNCRQAGIKDSQGNLYVALRDTSGKIRSLESFEQISNLVQKQGNGFPAYLASNGIKLNQGTQAIQSFCSDPSIFDASGSPANLQIAHRGFSPDDRNTIDGHSIDITYSSRKDYGFKSELVHCDSKKGEIAVKAVFDGLNADLKIGADTWSGTLNYNGCVTKFSNVPKRTWGGYYQDPKMSFQMDLSPDSSFLSLDLFSVSDQCKSKGAPAANPVWLEKYSVGLRDPKDRWNAYNKKLDEERQEATDESDPLKQPPALRATLLNDWKLCDEGKSVAKTHPERTKAIIEQFRSRLMEELEKSRYGEKSSRMIRKELEDCTVDLRFSLDR